MPLKLIGRVFFTMSFTEKIDVLDMIIEVLMEHEQNLDSLIRRIERVADRLGVSTPEDELARRFHEPL